MVRSHAHIQYANSAFCAATFEYSLRRQTACTLRSRWLDLNQRSLGSKPSGFTRLSHTKRVVSNYTTFDRIISLLAKHKSELSVSHPSIQALHIPYRFCYFPVSSDLQSHQFHLKPGVVLALIVAQCERGGGISLYLSDSEVHNFLLEVIHLLDPPSAGLPCVPFP